MRNTFVRSTSLLATVLAFTACSDASPITGPDAMSAGAYAIDARRAETAAGSPLTSHAQLLVCPSTQSFTASAVIGREGGSLSVGGATMTLPQKAVNRPTLFTMTVPASQYVEVEIVAEDRPHFNFDKRVSITLDYSRCGAEADEKPLTAWHIDPRSKDLLEQMPGRKDRRDNNVSFGTDHLSGYALAW
jgi:hypothetical protein